LGDLPLDGAPDQVDALTDGSRRGVYEQGGIFGRLVGRGDAGELGDLADARLPVEALDVPGLADLERRAEIYLEEPIRADDLARALAVLPERRNHRHQRDRAGVVEQPRDLGGAAEILGAVASREAEVPVQTEAKIVAVERIHVTVLGVETA